MGASYSNLQVRAENSDAVKEALISLKCFPVFVSKAENGWVSAFPWAMEEDVEKEFAQADAERAADIADGSQSKSAGSGNSLSLSPLEALCTGLSESLQTAVLGFAIYNSDVLVYILAENGRIVSLYNSWPGYTAGGALTDTPTPAIWQSDLLVPYCIAGTTTGAIDKMLSGSGSGLDSGLNGGTGLRSVKNQLVKSSSWWAKPFIWSVMTIIEILKVRSKPSSVVIWRGVRLATAFATLLDLPPERMNSGYKQIKAGTAPLRRRILDHILSAADSEKASDSSSESAEPQG